jgi:hypothetical protein
MKQIKANIDKEANSMEVIESNKLMTWDEFAKANNYIPDGILCLYLPVEITLKDGQKMNSIAYLKEDGKIIPVWANCKGPNQDVYIARPIK